MNRSTIRTLTLLLAGWLAVSTAQAQHRKNDEKYEPLNAPKFDDPSRVSPNRQLTHRIGGTETSVEWGAPSVRGRRLTGGLVSTYKVWRTGANEATVIHFSTDVVVEGEPLPAGTYALFTIGGKKAWTFIFNEDYQQWGAFTYDRKKDRLRVKVDPGTDEHVEQLQFSIEDTGPGEGLLHLRWGTLAASIRIESAAAD